MYGLKIKKIGFSTLRTNNHLVVAPKAEFGVAVTCLRVLQMSKLLTWSYQLWVVGLEVEGRDSCPHYPTTSGYLLSCKYRAGS